MQSGGSDPVAALLRLMSNQNVPAARSRGEMRYPDAVVAAVKGAHNVMTVKAIHAACGIPILILRDWVSGKRRANVNPDPDIAEALRESFRARLRVSFSSGKGHRHDLQGQAHPTLPATGPKRA